MFRCDVSSVLAKYQLRTANVVINVCEKCSFWQFFSYDIARTRGAQHTNHRDDILKAFMGESVIANYNKLVYRIDDIDFSETPRGGFMKNGVKVNFHLVNCCGRCQAFVLTVTI